MKMWIAREEGGLLCVYRFRPWLSDDCHGVWRHIGGCFPISTGLFPEVTFENSPIEVELKLVNNVGEETD